jgi:glutamate-5-semialdehyde dehydrogenase
MQPPTPHADSTDLVAQARAAREASRLLATLGTLAKNALILDLASAVLARRAEILEANAQDVSAATAAGLPPAKLQRLGLTERSIDQLAAGLRQIAALPDPVGEVTRRYDVPSGLHVRKVRTPLGVIAMIYEARPAVTVDAFALCFKAGNACILKGGKEAARCNSLLAGIVRERSRAAGLPEAAITSVSTLDRDGLRQMLKLDQFIDLVIPRGGTELIRFVAEHSSIPTIQHYQGVCHVFVDESADLAMAERVCLTGKTSAPATCNATECVLVHTGVAERFVPRLVAAYAAAGVEVRGDELTRRLGGTSVKPAAEDDFGREFLELIVAVKAVPDLDAAVAHIHAFGSNHTEAIVTGNQRNADEFTRRVQASCVVVNASTRFNDGFQLGLGAEIGISTTKIHAYGPMGLEELTTQRFVVEGSGQVR